MANSMQLTRHLKILAAVLALYFRYQAAMAKQEADKPWNRRQW